MMPNAALAQLLPKVYGGGADVSLRELIISLGLPLEDLLGSAIRTRDFICEMQLELRPEVERGDLDARRVLVTRQSYTEATINELIASEERQGLEFKSTLFCSLVAFRDVPRKIEISEGVVHSALKTICAFANSGGGRLLIGVEDDASVCGLSPDFQAKGCSWDRWHLGLRDLIDNRFYGGKAFNNFVSVNCVALQSESIAVIDVVASSDSVFLKSIKDKGRHDFFVRQGNRSVALDLPEFEARISG